MSSRREQTLRAMRNVREVYNEDPVPQVIDSRHIRRMASWRPPRGALSRQLLALMDRVEALEAEVERLKAGTLPDLR